MRCPACQAAVPPPSDPSQRRARCPGCGRDVDLAAVASAEGTVEVRPPAPPPADASDPLVGKAFAGGRYRIEGLLGVGGMGRVYRATQTALGRAVAVKILSPELASDEQFRRRFDREAGTLASLDHPNIVAVHDMGVEDGLPYIVMAIVVGREGKPVSLRTLLDAGPLEEELCLRIVQQTCAALDYAHKKGVVHRDIKPGNILIDAEGHAKIADFGIARTKGLEAGAPALTTTGAVLGTLKYMAPEQLDDASRADPRSDLYSLGVVFYEMLTGHAPVGRFELPSEAREGLDRRLDAIVDRALRRAAAQRYQSAEQFARDLSRITTEREYGRLHAGDGGKGAPAADEPSARRTERPAATPAPAAERKAPAAPAPLASPGAAAPSAPVPSARARRKVPVGVVVGAVVVAAGLASIPLWSGSGGGSGGGEVGKVAPPNPPPPARGETPAPPAMGDAPNPPAMDEGPVPPAMGEAPTPPAMGDGANGPPPWKVDPAPAMGEPAMGDPGMGGSTWASQPAPSMGEPAMEGGGTWANGMDTPPPAPGPDVPAPSVAPGGKPRADRSTDEVSAAVVAARTDLLALLRGAGIAPEDVDSTRARLVKEASAATPDLDAARAAVAGVLALLEAEKPEEVAARAPTTVVAVIGEHTGAKDEAAARALVAEALAGWSIGKPRVTDAVALGPDWALFKFAATDLDTDDESTVRGTALAIRERGAWKAYLTFAE